MVDFATRATFVIDGTSVSTLNHGAATKINRLMYCWFKGDSQHRYQVIMDVSGWVVYIVGHEGHLWDDAAMKRDADSPDCFLQKYNEAFANELKGRLRMCKKSNDSISVILADKGYGNWKPPFMCELWLTLSATEAAKNKDGEAAKKRFRYMNDKAWQVYLFAHSKIATYRQRIERLFGRLWMRSNYLRGPCLASQLVLILNMLKIQLAMGNRRIEEGISIL